MTNAPPQPSEQACERGAFLLREVVMPRYLLTIGNSQHLLARTSHQVQTLDLRSAMAKAHRALLRARELSEAGREYNYWTVSQRDPETGNYRQLRTYKLD